MEKEINCCQQLVNCSWADDADKQVFSTLAKVYRGIMVLQLTLQRAQPWERYVGLLKKYQNLTIVPIFGIFEEKLMNYE